MTGIFSKNKLFILISLILTFSFHAYSEEIFNGNLSQAERDKLFAGETVIRNIDSTKELCVSASSPVAQKALEVVKNLKPAYIAEILQVIPMEGNENYLEYFDQRIEDVSSYVGIPYYSERNGQWYDLYSSATIKETLNSDNAKTILCDLYMEPFGVINTRILIEQTEESFYYESTNLNRLRYQDKFNCVNPEKMKSVIAIFPDGDNWVLYGVGAVNAPSIFFLRDRVETSFMNRIKTFCAYFFKTN